MKKILSVLVILFSAAHSFATTWTIQTSGLNFVPDSITITLGDTVNFFQLGGIHDALEVSQTTWNANGNTPLAGGFHTPLNGGIVAGLTVGTHYYVCSNHHGSSMKGRIFVQPGVQLVVIPNVWINEIHYDNANVDTFEGFEIAGPAGVDLACFRVLLYNGLNGQLYATHNLNGVIPDLACGYGTVWFGLPSNGMQNGNTSQTEPEGIVLEYAPLALACGILHQDTILQFLSYEGVFTATNGRALGLTSTNIGVVETSTSTLSTTSLQLGGTGTSYSQFTWNPSAISTHDLLNNNQAFCAVQLASYRFTSTSATFSESAGTVVAGYVKAADVLVQTQTVDVVLKSGNAADINNYVTQTFTFSPGGIDSLPLSITITDDILVEGTENLIFAIRNPSNNGTVEADSLFTLTITDNDVVPDPSVEFVITSSSHSEGIVSFQLAVAITNPNSNSTSVDINVLGGGTATFGTDFTFSPLTVTFPANSTLSEFITITVADDIIAEGNESFTFQLNFPTNNAAVGANNQHSVTILDNDILSFDISPPLQSVNENIGVVIIPVSLSHISANSTSVTLQLETQGTVATQGIDFEFNDTTLTWPAGSFGPILVPVTVIDDTLYEPNEPVRFKLVNATNGASFLNDTFRLVIHNNDPRPPAPCSDIFFSKYVEGTSNNRAVELFNPTSATVDLSEYRIYKSNDGGGSWWTYELNGTLAPGAAYVCVHASADSVLASKADTLDVFFDFSGNDALVLIHLSDTIDIIGQLGINPGASWPLAIGSTEDHTLIRSPYNYEGSTNWSAAADSWRAYPNNMFDSLGFHHIAPCGTIEPPAYIHFTVLSDTVSESTGTVQVVVQIDNPNSILVRYLLARDDSAATALPGVDYNFANHNFITTTGGTTFDTVSITVLEDQLVEPLETVVLHFLNLSRGTTVIQDSTFTLYIEDNDILTASFLGAGFSYIEKDTVVGVKVFLSTFSTVEVSVNVSLNLGSADNLVDFMFSDTVLVFPANSTDTQTAWITIIDDIIAEPNEQINFDLTDTNGVPIGISAYTLTIIDNDLTVDISQAEMDNTIKLFPNPVMNTIIIETENELLDAEITDLLGNAVMRLGKLSVGKNSLDVSLLCAGMYFLNARNEQGMFGRRFIKQD